MLLETIETPSFIGKRHARPPEFEIERERERRWNQLPRRLWYISMSHDQLRYRFTSGDLTFQKILELEVRKLRPTLEDICCLHASPHVYYVVGISQVTKLKLTVIGSTCVEPFFEEDMHRGRKYEQVLGHLTEPLMKAKLATEHNILGTNFTWSPWLATLHQYLIQASKIII